MQFSPQKRSTVSNRWQMRLHPISYFPITCHQERLFMCPDCHVRSHNKGGQECQPYLSFVCVCSDGVLRLASVSLLSFLLTINRSLNWSENLMISSYFCLGVSRITLDSMSIVLLLISSIESLLTP
jgi:hypothetical protein